MVYETILDKEKYKNLLIGAVVENQPILEMKISIKRFDENLGDKNITISQGNKVEIAYIDGTDLKYVFGKIAHLYDWQDIIILDVSTELNTCIRKVPIGNIRDIEIFNGAFKILPENNKKEELNSFETTIISNYNK